MCVGGGGGYVSLWLACRLLSGGQVWQKWPKFQEKAYGWARLKIHPALSVSNHSIRDDLSAGWLAMGVEECYTRFDCVDAWKYKL